jgi:BirA family transcriptional regulator, biotin operon repressor / biotin---[acetyl-CoA-carboxylase] ligase
MDLNEQLLSEALVPRLFRFYEQTESTNDVALTWLREDASTGSVVIADEQIRGRGRMGRTWQTPAGEALALSVILHPPKEALAQISMLGALAVYDLLKQLDAPQISIKWPNDVQLNGLKVCGILPEVMWDGERLSGVVLGMGLNVRVDFTNSPLAYRATSLETVLGKPFSRAQLCKMLLTKGDVSGTAEDVDQEGALLVRSTDGELHRVLAGDIVLGGS